MASLWHSARQKKDTSAHSERGENTKKGLRHSKRMLDLKIHMSVRASEVHVRASVGTLPWYSRTTCLTTFRRMPTANAEG